MQRRPTCSAKSLDDCGTSYMDEPGPHSGTRANVLLRAFLERAAAVHAEAAYSYVQGSHDGDLNTYTHASSPHMSAHWPDYILCSMLSCLEVANI